MQCSYKLLLNALVLLSLGAVFYVVQNESRFQNKIHSSLGLAPTLTQEYNLWCIFTKANSSYKLRQNLKRFARSLVLNATVPLSLHVISDNASQVIADDVFGSLLPQAKTKFTWEYHDVQQLAGSLAEMTHMMQQHFSSQPGAYYGDALFFLSLGLHRVTSQRRAAMLDVDVELRVDVGELFTELDRLPPGALVAAAPEQTPVYRHVLHMHRARHRSSKFGEPRISGGNPGVNSGVLLLDLEGQRRSSLYQALLTAPRVSALCDKYQFQGHLGDQDWYTLVSQEHPALVHVLDCAWNRQLCLWWRHHGYHDIFDLFHRCPGPVKLYHGNCNTPIPTN